jgi:GAF domain-containing protein
VSRAVAQLQDLDRLLPQVAQLISQHFGFYHVGVFLIEEPSPGRRYAVLQAANSKGGQRMLARRHQLAVGSQGIVGHAADTGQARIALDVGADAVFFDNPDMPDTRSEMALPLRLGDEILGVLDVQSTREAAFDQTDVALLTVLADQITVAIQNAHLHQRTQAALREAQEVHQRYLRQEWDSFLGHRPRKQARGKATQGADGA